jgi:hypothetical protein
MKNLQGLLSSLPDHRGRSGRMYRFSSIILLVITGFMCGCNSLASVARFAQDLTRSERGRLGFWWKRVPSHPTLCIFFHALDVSALELALGSVAPAGVAFSMDGKRLRGSVSDNSPRGVHLLSCFVSALRKVTSQKRQTHGNEVTAALELLESLDLKDAIVTGDAMFAHPRVCETLHRKGAHYVFTLKDNQKPMKSAAERAFSLSTA